MHLIPQSWSHLHILVSVFPSVGLVFLLGFYAVALSIDNDAMKRVCLALFVILSILGHRMRSATNEERSSSGERSSPKTPVPNLCGKEPI